MIRTSGHTPRACRTIRLNTPRGRVLIGLPQTGTEQLIAAEKIQWQIAIVAVVAMEKTPLLMPVQRIIGRTGRAGLSGEAVSLVCGEDRPLLAAIERLINKRIEQLSLIHISEPTRPY